MIEEIKISTVELQQLLTDNLQQSLQITELQKCSTLQIQTIRAYKKLKLNEEQKQQLRTLMEGVHDEIVGRYGQKFKHNGDL